jgi:uncharacterized glyoxalase superfamily protein PhnB
MNNNLINVLSDRKIGPDQRWLQLGLKNAETSITLVTWFKEMIPGSIQGIVLETDDIDTYYYELRRRGLSISAIEEAPWAKYATFFDPDGNGWVLQESK